MYPNKAKYIFEQTCILFHISYRLTNKAILTKKCVIDFVIIYLFHINKLLIEIEQCFCDMHAVCVGFFLGKNTVCCGSFMLPSCLDIPLYITIFIYYLYACFLIPE